MRISDARYHRDHLRLDTALRFMLHEARTQTIRQWTGLSDDRIRKLYRSYLGSGQQIRRHRGRSPQQTAYFTRTRRLRAETAWLTSLYLMLGVVAGAPAPRGNSHPSPSVQRGRLLCEAYEVFRTMAPETLISFEHAVFLARSLGRCEELKPMGCSNCGAVVVADCCTLHPPRCLACDHPAQPMYPSV